MPFIFVTPYRREADRFKDSIGSIAFEELQERFAAS